MSIGTPHGRFTDYTKAEQWPARRAVRRKTYWVAAPFDLATRHRRGMIGLNSPSLETLFMNNVTQLPPYAKTVLVEADIPVSQRQASECNQEQELIVER
jgi:hypothetical protein